MTHMFFHKIVFVTAYKKLKGKYIIIYLNQIISQQALLVFVFTQLKPTFIMSCTWLQSPCNGMINCINRTDCHIALVHEGASNDVIVICVHVAAVTISLKSNAARKARVFLCLKRKQIYLNSRGSL